MTYSNGFEVTPFETIDLEVGSSRWMRVGELAAGLLGAAAVASSSARPGWIIVSAFALGAVCAGTALAARRAASIKRLTLRGNGSVVLFTDAGAVSAQRGSEGWASRWFCVVPVRELLRGRTVRCLVCRSRNNPDAYRRLLMNLRMGDTGGSSHGATWT